jgi:hypothetical protein
MAYRWSLAAQRVAFSFLLRASVRHTEAFFAAAEREPTILRHQSNAARVATGFELNNSQDDNELWLIDVPPHRIRPTV